MKNIDIEGVVSILNKQNHYNHLSWKMTDWCNYKCSYCIAPAKTWVYLPTKENMQEHYVPIAQAINILIQNSGVQTRLTMIGGEIGFFDLPFILKEIPTPLLQHVSIVTNFSANLTSWKKLIDYGNSRNLRINILASYHKEQCKDEQDFIEKAILLKDNIIVKCVLNNENIESYKPFIEKLIANDVRCQIIVERNQQQKCVDLTPENLNYCKRMTDLFSKQTKPKFELTLNNGNKQFYVSNVEILNDMKTGYLNTRGFYCDAGMHNLRINPDGTVSKAVCQFLLHNPVGHINNLKGFYKDPVLCQVTKGCSFCSQTSISKNKEDLI